MVIWLIVGNQVLDSICLLGVRVVVGLNDRVQLIDRRRLRNNDLIESVSTIHELLDLRWLLYILLKIHAMDLF